MLAFYDAFPTILFDDLESLAFAVRAGCVSAIARQDPPQARLILRRAESRRAVGMACHQEVRGIRMISRTVRVRSDEAEFICLPGEVLPLAVWRRGW